MFARKKFENFAKKNLKNFGGKKEKFRETVFKIQKKTIGRG